MILLMDDASVILDCQGLIALFCNGAIVVTGARHKGQLHVEGLCSSPRKKKFFYIYFSIVSHI